MPELCDRVRTNGKLADKLKASCDKRFSGLTDRKTDTVVIVSDGEVETATAADDVFANYVFDSDAGVKSVSVIKPRGRAVSPPEGMKPFSSNPFNGGYVVGENGVPPDYSVNLERAASSWYKVPNNRGLLQSQGISNRESMDWMRKLVMNEVERPDHSVSTYAKVIKESLETKWGGPFQVAVAESPFTSPSLGSASIYAEFEVGDLFVHIIA
ncbi:unnamed protein product [Symbiodinium natans]|uniref:Uncharacterized protein n=1 Tax=Symbiodinium natans TaxID=878477 RepID=A0A812U1J6_9DINO|nr:unnamed protein product [Symbiodinium natans]